jgi:predicted MFS family arabinose efflux permease
VQAVGAPAALVADAGSFVTSAACLRGVRATEPPAAAAGDLAGGVRFLRRSPALRAALAATATVNLGSFVWWSVLVLFLTRTLGLSPSAVGVVLTGGAVGGLVGTALTGRLVRAVGLWRSLAVGCVVFAVPVLAVPFAHGMAIPLAAEVVSGLGVVVLDISASSLLAELVPDGLRSRVQGAYLTVNHGMRPVGALLGGALGAAVGTRAAIGIGATVALTGVVWLRQPSRASSSARRSSVRASSLR